MPHAPRTLLLLALSLVVGGWMATAQADPPPWAPAHGWRAKHHYIYYPDNDVYYSPESGTWFWLESDGWRVGTSLPSLLHGLLTGDGVDIRLDVARPYLRNRYVRRHYRHWEHDDHWREDRDDWHDDWDEDRDDWHDDWDEDRDDWHDDWDEDRDDWHDEWEDDWEDRRDDD